jgi:hypothetical protein
MPSLLDRYCRFFLGRRCADDERQIGRWGACCGQTGRWRRNLIAKCVRSGKAFDDYSVSPVVRQTLLHWAYELSEKDYNWYARHQLYSKSHDASCRSSRGSRWREGEAKRGSELSRGTSEQEGGALEKIFCPGAVFYLVS